MSNTGLRIASEALFLFHLGLVLFNCLGWIWPKTRRLHLITLALTASSWFLLGLWFGPGYCLCTDLHWRVRAALGERITEQTYIQYLVARLTGWMPNAKVASTATAIVFVAVSFLSLWLNLQDRRQRRLAVVQ